jgi:N-acetylglucosaminyldiphosphoundecaprenol N-acetyl-beta-D-mannosaminyltransferase
MHEPRRLSGRYLVEPWFLLRLLSMDFLRKGGRLSSKLTEEVLGHTLPDGL